MAAASNVVRVPVGDSTDVALAAGGDRQAFERLYRTHANRVFSLCARMSGSRVRGEELKASRTEQSDVEDDRRDEMARAPLHIERMDLAQAISKLPDGARRVFVLHDVEGYKHEEIAEMLGITSGGSKAQLHRARLLLREALER